MVSALEMAVMRMHCCEQEGTKSKDKTISAETGPTGSPLSFGSFPMALAGLVVLLLAVLVFNQFLINDLNRGLVAAQSLAVASAVPATTEASTGSPSASLSSQQIWEQIAPTGVPPVYGAELGVNYDDPEAAIPTLYQFDDYAYYQRTLISLDTAAQERYIRITTSISCEYCCGAATITTNAGQPACGCAHSAAMRGLAKYLLQNHPDMSDEDILAELGKWKVLFFPANSVQKAAALQANGLPTDYISLSSNLYRGIESQSASRSAGSGLASQVGGC